jgi:flagellin-like protein
MTLFKIKLINMKGISPLIASVLLIAITMTLAAILASFVSSYTRQQLTAMPACVGGTMGFSTSAYPKWDDDTAKTITAVMEVDNVELNDFSFEVLLKNDTVLSSDDANKVTIAAGSTGTIKSGVFTGIYLANISKVRVIAGNCPTVRTDWANLKGTA